MGARSPSRYDGRPAGGRLWPAGCLGLFLGILLGLGGLIALIALMAGASLPALPAAASDEDIVIHVQERYLTQMVADKMPALPSGVASAMTLDLQPGNKILFKGRLRSTLTGSGLEGDVSGVVRLDVREGKLVLSFSDLRVFGFSLPAIGDTLANEMTGALNQTINDQITAGLGQDARIVGLSTDDRQLIVNVRGQP